MRSFDIQFTDGLNDLHRSRIDNVLIYHMCMFNHMFLIGSSETENLVIFTKSLP